MNKQTAILKLASKWSKTKIPNYYAWGGPGAESAYHRACARKYCGDKIIQILKQEKSKW